MRRRAAVLACAAACAAWPAAARADEATSAQVRALAIAAQDDPAALLRLRRIDVVDGRAVALGDALRGSDEHVRERLRALAAAGSDAASAPGGAQGPRGARRAREQARDVLAQRRFQPSSLPTPLRSVRERIGETLRKLGRPFEDAFRWVAGWFPGGSVLLSIVLGAIALGGAAALAARLAARRTGAAGGPGAAGRGHERMSAARLRRDAEAAEQRGELELALRLRFRAGLVDLDAHELIELRPALTNHELLRALPSATLAELVDGFEAVAYGGRPAAPDDVRRARDGWPRVVAEASVR